VQPELFQDVEAEEVPDNSEGWAVSYSDVLMVLLCFFVLFFSTEDQTLLQATKNFASRTPSSSSTTHPGSTLQQTLTHLPRSKVIQAGQEIRIEFDNDIFERGEFKLEGKGRADVLQALELLKPYKDQLVLSFIGHTDTVTLRPRNDMLENNFDLSALRASKAMGLAIATGYSTKNLRIRAAAENERNSRTISILLSTAYEEHHE